jgi:DNA-binding CsgD family transcriptional regulator
MDLTPDPGHRSSREPSRGRTVDSATAVPTLPSAYVARHRLTDMIHRGIAAPLTLVSAPAGTGKTVLAADFARSCRWPLAWITLDDADQNHTEFWAHLLGAFELAGVDVAAVESVGPPSEPGTAGAIRLAETLATRRQPMVLVLDTGAMPVDSTRDSTLAAVLRRSGGMLRLVLLTRADPTPVLYTRSDHQFTQVTSADLAATEEEALALMHRAGADATSAQARVLHNKTGGWIAGLQFAAIGLTGCADVARGIEDFSGTDINVAAYLFNEVLKALPSEIRDLLIRTSVAEVLTPELVEVLVGKPQGPHSLEFLARGNPFIECSRIGSTDRYRYQPLFREFLRAQLAFEESKQPQAAGAAPSHAHAALSVPKPRPVAISNADVGADLGEALASVRWVEDALRDAVRAQAVPRSPEIADHISRVKARLLDVCVSLGLTTEASNATAQSSSRGFVSSAVPSPRTLRSAEDAWRWADAPKRDVSRVVLEDDLGTGPSSVHEVDDKLLEKAEARRLKNRSGTWVAADSYAQVVRRLERATRSAERGDAWTARADLEVALRLAEPGQIRLPFQEAPASVQRLLVGGGQLARRHPWILSDEPARKPAPQGGISPGAASEHVQVGSEVLVVEPLTVKEREVLYHLAELLSTREIASAMFVSVNTVRTHVRSILRKMGASRRNEAVRRAWELGLLVRPTIPQRRAAL